MATKIKYGKRDHGERKVRIVKSRISVQRTGGEREHIRGAFQACVLIGRTAGPTGKRPSEAAHRKAYDLFNCGYGKNPRDAIANALFASGRKVKRRAGSFAGMKSKTKRSR